MQVLNFYYYIRKMELLLSFEFSRDCSLPWIEIILKIVTILFAFIGGWIAFKNLLHNKEGILKPVVEVGFKDGVWCHRVNVKNVGRDIARNIELKISLEENGETTVFHSFQKTHRVFYYSDNLGTKILAPNEQDSYRSIYLSNDHYPYDINEVSFLYPKGSDLKNISSKKANLLFHMKIRSQGQIEISWDRNLRLPFQSKRRMETYRYNDTMIAFDYENKKATQN